MFIRTQTNGEKRIIADSIGRELAVPVGRSEADELPPDVEIGRNFLYPPRNDSATRVRNAAPPGENLAVGRRVNRRSIQSRGRVLFEDHPAAEAPEVQNLEPGIAAQRKTCRARPWCRF
jgi:hypothetical protein